MCQIFTETMNKQRYANFKTHVNALTLATFGMLSGSAFAQNSISVYIAPQGSAHATVASAYTSSSSQNAVEPGFWTKLQTDTINSQKFTKLVTSLKRLAVCIIIMSLRPIFLQILLQTVMQATQVIILSVVHTTISFENLRQDMA